MVHQTYISFEALRSSLRARLKGVQTFSKCLAILSAITLSSVIPSICNTSNFPVKYDLQVFQKSWPDFRSKASWRSLNMTLSILLWAFYTKVYPGYIYYKSDHLGLPAFLQILQDLTAFSFNTSSSEFHQNFVNRYPGSEKNYYKKFSYCNRSRIKVLSQNFGQDRGMVDSVKMFLSSGVIIMQNMVTVCRIVWDAGLFPLK